MCGACPDNQRLRGRIPGAEERVAFEPLAHPLVAEGLDFLKKNLPEGLYYHDIEHTKGVIEATVRLALFDVRPPRDIELLAIAAAWHDTGYAVTTKHNERYGAKNATDAMIRKGGYTNQEIADVHAAILDTQVTFDWDKKCVIQTARGRLSPWLLDGDLSNFGSPDFFLRSLALMRELTGVEANKVGDLRSHQAIDFISQSVRMLNAHSFQTEAAKALLGEQKNRNLSTLKRLLGSLIKGPDQSCENAWRAMHP